LIDYADTRPSPDVLLEESRTEGRGRLRIFLGASPGVGKTYAMLETAHVVRRQGVDVVIGVVETHGRPETQALVEGFEAIPLKLVPYQQRAFSELNVDALIQRKPKLALIDELAHSNVPGCRHVKRWQDVDDVLEAGIDVWTTLNVQHLESLNDIVTRITGVRVRETVPDTVLERADEIELIDLPAVELLRRLDDGKVYLGEHARQAREHFFTPTNLTALRELALRVAAQRVDSQMQRILRRHAVRGPWPTRERLLIAVGGDAVSKSLVRAAARMAEQHGAQWIAVHVINSRANTLPDAAKDRIAAVLRLAEELGGEALTIPGEDVARELLDYARTRNVTQIIIGRPRTRALWWRWLFRRSVATALTALASDLQITMVPREEEPRPRSEATPATAVLNTGTWRDYAWALLAVSAATAAGLALHGIAGTANQAMLYLLAVMLVALRVGTVAATAGAICGAVAFNFFFTEPRFSLAMDQREDVITLLMYCVAAVFTGRLGLQLRGQMQALRKTAGRTANLNEFSRKVAGALDREEVLAAIADHVRATLQCDCAVVLDAPGDTLITAVRRGLGPDYQWPPTERAAAQWAWEHAQPAGFATSTLPAARWRFVPMRVARRMVGLLALNMRERGRPLSAGQGRLLDAIADQAAVALERVALTQEVENKRLAGETEQLRSALLASVSHDLRTPLVSILGAASSLRSQTDKLSAADQSELLETIEEEAARLNRFVQNLLDMTRLGHGRLELKRQWCDLRDLIRQAVSRFDKRASSVRIVVEAESDLGLAHVDPMLIEQVFVNVLDNAIQHSPIGGAVHIRCNQQRASFTVDIEDEGPGIPAADRERVFDLFYRVEARDYQRPGTGLGLSICRGLLAAHGGSIRALTASTGRGTLIRMALPRPQRDVA
jgi:two-component system sensor histidine kinase KdpD